jgi:glycosyltransferase involved in cell wall biosynthesis
MNNNKLLTIIITTYKRPLQLKRCIESIQKNEYLEIIVVDDCPNKSGKLIADQYSYIRYFSKLLKTNVANSRNIGIENARGEYIYFIDDDDFMTENSSNEILKIINAFSAFNFIRFNYKILDNSGLSEKFISDIDPEELLIVNHIPIGAFIIKSNSIKLKFDEKLKTHEDWNFILYNITKPILHIDKTIIIIDKLTENSISKTFTKAFYEDFLTVYHNHPAPQFSQKRLDFLLKTFGKVPPDIP